MAQMRIKAVPFGIAFGVVYAAVFFLYGILAAFAETIGTFYVGFGPTVGRADRRCLGLCHRLRVLRARRFAV
jgi:hypothetical protein